MISVSKATLIPARSGRSTERVEKLTALQPGEMLYDADAKGASTFNGSCFKLKTQRDAIGEKCEFVRRDGEWVEQNGKLVKVSDTGATVWRVR